MVYFLYTTYCVKQDNKSIVMEQPSMQGSGMRSSQSTAPIDSVPNRIGIVVRSPSSPEDKFPDNISSSSEASESTGNSKYKLSC